MYPHLGPFPAYQLSWIVAIALGGLSVGWLMRRAGHGSDPAWLSIALVLAAGFAGSKALFLAESWPEWWTNGNGVLAALSSEQMRLPGGILAAAVAGPWIARAARMPFPAWADLMAPALGLTVFWLRIGCFLQGCCHGTPSATAWAVEFPAPSDAYLWHVERGWVLPGSGWSLPVHPLQLYFGAAGLAIFVALAAYERRKRYAGEVALLFGLAYFGSTALLEILRARQHPLTHGLAVAVTLVLAVVAARREWRSKRNAARTMHAPGRTTAAPTSPDRSPR